MIDDNATAARLDELRAHFASGHGVCPFARNTLHRYLPDRFYAAGLSAFRAAPRGSSLVLMSSQPGIVDAAALREWATLHATLIAGECHALTHPADDRKVRESVELYFLSLLEGRVRIHGRAVNPFPCIGDAAIVTIAMGPAYPASHPRYAPHACLVLTWLRDISPHIGTPLSIAVRARMFAAHGGEYDADELVVEWPVVA